MSFTCPSCLWTSANKNDLVNLYCVRCHEFQQESFEASPVQKVIIRALLAPEPIEAAKRIFADSELPVRPWDNLLLEIMPFWSAQRLGTEQLAALVMLTRAVATESYESMTQLKG